MATAIRINLSGSTSGKPISIAAGGTIVHTATSDATPGAGGIWDEIWLWVTYSTAVGNPTVTVKFGGSTSPDNVWVFTPNYICTPVLIIPGFLLQNSEVVTVSYAVTTSGNLSVAGYVNRITN